MATGRDVIRVLSGRKGELVHRTYPQVVDYPASLSAHPVEHYGEEPMRRINGSGEPL